MSRKLQNKTHQYIFSFRNILKFIKALNSGISEEDITLRTEKFDEIWIDFLVDLFRSKNKSTYVQKNLLQQRREFFQGFSIQSSLLDQSLINVTRVLDTVRIIKFNIEPFKGGLIYYIQHLMRKLDVET